MARRTDRAPQPTRSATPRRRIRPTAATRRLSGLSPEPVHVPQPREDADAIASEHPIMHWVLVTDDNGRTRPEARWL
ncbi:hypothetical protein Q8791_21535 [Nocardiopsis sp. CT-R113]|uniref:Uncharacterized protein n=1 Tax=Nocardiopsis codii TaxID=3065942 RepID=A0ABU7KC38_9ACTN|nr:hypothetical protein [Nocardiopsis sp. CT-R113]MEE2039806.1 hypothetical protein [Nocardiopsis sp. CT-R113]